MMRASGPSGEYRILQSSTAEGRLQQAGYSRQGKAEDKDRNKCQGQNTVLGKGEIRSVVRGKLGSYTGSRQG